MHSRGTRALRASRTTRWTTTLVAVIALIFGTAAPSFAVSAPAVPATTQTVAGGPVKTSLAGFNAGNIISDAVFTDESTMTESQIQTFFDSKVKTCRGGIDEDGRAIVCLKDFKTDTVNRPADTYCKGYTGAKGESAARIIYRVAQSCNINPQVLIVMLQKEQSLVTHTWPSAWRYDKALGQGCPDDAPCNPAYVGFFYQIYGAARQMQTYMEGRYFTWYAPGKTWNIRYDVEVSCGSAPVYVANKATSALYYYTPYQPNAAALKAGYGPAEPCGSYGNRNFYNYFTDWFGSTQVGTPATPPPGPTPVLDSLATSSFVTALDGSGTLWGYPFADGIWGSRVRLASGIATSSTVAIVGDTTGSGVRDAIIVSGGDSSIMYGTKTAFRDATALPTDLSNAVLLTVAGDVNGDDAPDLLTTDPKGRLLLWPGDGRGAFRSPIQVGVGWEGFDMLVGGVDLSGDGKVDLIGRDRTGVLWLYVGDGKAGWPSNARLGQGWGGMSSIFSPGDFTGDDTPDVLARSADGALYLYAGDHGGLKDAGRVGVEWDVMTSLGGAGEAAGSVRPLPAGAGDVDRDGASDAVALMEDGTVALYSGDGAGAWRGVSQLSSGWGQTDRLLALGDFTGDGLGDFGRIDAAGVFHLYPGDAGGGLGKPTVIGQGWRVMSKVIGGIDFDGDRNPDIIARDGAGALLLYRGNGRGGWLTTGVPIGSSWNAFDVIVNLGDFTGDGHADIAARRPDGTLWLYPTTGSTGWGAARQIGRGWGGLSLIAGPGDFDGDGNTDLLARTADGDLLLYSGDGRGTWKGSRIIGWGWQVVKGLS